MSITCITAHAPQLEGKYKKLVDSGLSEKDAAIKVAIEEHKALFDELNKFKASIGIKLTKDDKTYVSPEVVVAQEEFEEIKYTKDEVVDAETSKIKELEGQVTDRVQELGNLLGFDLGKPVSKSQLSNTPLPVNTEVANGFDTFKKKFGETAAKAIRENIPFALDYPTEFAEFISKKIPVKEDIAFVVKNLSQRLDGLFRLESDKNIETVNVKNKTPEELSKEAGYVFHRPKSENDILAFKKDFENGEVLCTYNDVEGRMQGHFIFWLRRNDAESVLPAKKITQEYLKDKSEGSSLWRGYLDAKGLKLADGSYDLSNLTASRQDPYGTSSMSVQIGRRGGNVSIKNRYNHTVNNPDATFGNDLNTIIDGLDDAVFGIEGVTKKSNQELQLPDNITSDSKGRFFKYDQEIENIYVSQHGYVSNGDMTIIDKSYQRMIDNYVFDSKGNTVTNVTMGLRLITGDIKGVNFEKNKITVESESGEFEFELVNGFLNKLSSNAEKISGDFLLHNTTLESISLPNTKTISHHFLYSNEALKSISLPNVISVGNNFLLHNTELKSISFPKVEEIGEDFLRENRELESISLPNTRTIAHHFLYSNEVLKSISLPNVISVGANFLRENRELESISLPNTKNIHHHFLRENLGLKSISLPTVISVGDNFLRENRELESISLPNVRAIGANFLGENRELESISLPNTKTIYHNFLYSNEALKSISFPKVEEIGEDFMVNNKSVEKPIIAPQPTSKSQLSLPDISQLIAQFRGMGKSDDLIKEFLNGKGYKADEIQSAMGGKTASKPVESTEAKKKVESDSEGNEGFSAFSGVAVADVKASGDLVKLANKNIDSDEFRDTLSNKPRESGRALSEEDKKLRVKKLMDAFKLGVDIIEKAKEDFGDKYVENLLAFVRDNLNSLGVDNVSLILISLENDLNKQMLDDPDNLTLQKQERLVQNITIKFQRALARGLGYGRLRQIARVGYDVEAVTDQFFTTKQLQGKAKIEKAIQSDMDAINEEAESQEQDSDIVIEEPKVKRDSKVVRADIKAEIEKLRKSLIKSARGVGGAMSSLPFQQQIKDATPHIIKLSKLFAELGGMKVKDIIAEIRTEIKKIAPDVDEKAIEDVLRAEQQRKTNPKTPKDKLAEAKERTKERISELQQEIADKKKELKIRNKPETDAELVALQQQEKALKAVADQYLTQESIDQINESKEKSIVTKLENELKDLDEQISKQEKVQKEKKDPLSTPKIEQLKAIKKAKIDLLNQLDPNPKEFTKQALIEAGYGREITVTRKGGVKEKIQVLDWKKLAGEEGSIDNISAIVAQTLKDKGFSDVQIERMKDAFVQEIKDLRASIVDKAFKELEKQNKKNPSPSRRSSARRLAELYDLGLFEKNPDEFKYLLNKALGLSDLGQEAFFESEQFAKALKGIYAINNDEFFSRQFIREINLNISRLLNKVAMQEGSTLFKISTVASEIANLMLRVKLQNVKQFIDNQVSGRQERLIQDIGRLMSSEISDKEYEKMVKRYGKIIKDDITKNAGLYYGDINTPFLTKSQIEDYVNGLSKNRFYHYMISMALGKSYLEGADSMNKANLTEVIFRSALLKVMTDKTNPNKMTDEEASTFINESLFGQRFDEALQESARIIRKINTDAGIEILAETKENVYRGAMDLVKANLLSGGVVSLEMIEASFDAAYTVAGYGLGHEANNPISRGVNVMQQVLEAELKKSIQEKEWGKASIQTFINAIYRNILNPFVGGGTNWTVLGLQLSGVDIVSPLGYWWGKTKNRVDIGNKDDMKLLEKQLVDDFRRKTINRRYLIGTSAAALFTLAFYASGGDDEYEKWLEKNKWFKRYEATILPRLTLMIIAINNGTFGDWAINTFDRSAKFDALPKIIGAYKTYKKGNEPAKQKAYGELGNVVGQKFDLPFFSIRFMRDLQGIFKGIRGDAPERSDFDNIGALNGFFNYGGLDLIGRRPERTYMRNIEGYIPYADKETISFLRERNLDINANSDEAVLRDGIKSYITMNESPKYDKLWNNEVYKSIKTNMPKLKDLNEKQVKTFVTAIEYVATQKAQKEFGFKDASLQQIEINDVKYSFNKAQIAQREKFINTYLIDNKGSEDFNESFKKAVRDGRAVNSIESRIKMKMTNAKSYATKKMKEIYEYNTKALMVTPK